MSDYVICMDASGDIDREIAQENGIEFVPMEYSLGEEMRTSHGCEDEAVLKDRDMLVFVSELGSSSVVLGVRCWFRQEDFWQGKWRVTEECKLRLDECGIEIAYDQLDVHVDGKLG